MKKSFLLIGALCVGAAFVSCVDDSESGEVKELRKIQLGKEQANLDKKYWDMYEDAINNVKTYEGFLEQAQEDLDDIKSGKLTADGAKAAAVAYWQSVVDRNEKDIEDINAEIEILESMAGKTYEEIQEAKKAAKNAQEKADKEYADYWISLVEKGYNKDYNGNAVALSAGVSDKIDMLLAGLTAGVKYKNNKLDEVPFVKAMNTIFSKKTFYYEYDGNQIPSTSYDFVYDGDTYEASAMFKSKTYVLYDENGKKITEYLEWIFEDVKQNDAKTYEAALSAKVKDASDAEKAEFFKLQEDMTALFASLKDNSAYKTLLNEYVEHAKKLFTLSTASASAATIYKAYDAYNMASDNESEIAKLQDKIGAANKLNDAVKNANDKINKIENDIVDLATAQKYYEALIADLNSQIAANKAIADKYRALIVGSESSNNNQQQNTPAPAPEETPAE